ncbi:hypothetical protein [Bacillus sp. EB600]|uniref:hypothetical protein n=1 Tax=Bacillus sp. EB600 TaxID=2806345 RepID=UPI00210E2D7D|nr:hypothetical protein [Bacillus sp. EB600]MCQ6281993.1 hypothetical protein [Bacillus sp. EB600]
MYFLIFLAQNKISRISPRNLAVGKPILTGTRMGFLVIKKDKFGIPRFATGPLPAGERQKLGHLGFQDNEPYDEDDGEDGSDGTMTMGLSIRIQYGFRKDMAYILFHNADTYRLLCRDHLLSLRFFANSGNLIIHLLPEQHVIPYIVYPTDHTGL